jgi:rubredoxin
MSGASVPAPGTIARKGTCIKFYDPDGTRYGLPTYPYRWAPKGLLTRRQLTANGLRPGGQPVAAQIIWKHKGKRRVAYLYRADAAKPKREATLAQRAAISSALRARRTCPTCGVEKDYYIPLSTGECNDCSARWGR